MMYSVLSESVGVDTEQAILSPRASDELAEVVQRLEMENAMLKEKVYRLQKERYSKVGSAGVSLMEDREAEAEAEGGSLGEGEGEVAGEEATEMENVLEEVHEEEQWMEDMETKIRREREALIRKLSRRDNQINERSERQKLAVCNA
jgi:hypothetical protein